MTIKKVTIAEAIGQESRTIEKAIDEQLDKWEKGCEPVMRRHHSDQLEAFSLSKVYAYAH